MAGKPKWIIVQVDGALEVFYTGTVFHVERRHAHGYFNERFARNTALGLESIGYDGLCVRMIE